MSESTFWAVVRVRVEGFHCYPEAPEEVAFLRNLHRHEFHIELQLEQFHDDRDVEFILLKRWLAARAAEVEAVAASRSSCEKRALWLHAHVVRCFPGRRHKISVFEDGENGAVVEFGA